mmetsp:Transcript_28240/g.40943  ORF Transcript_28240/g.40943 Transcript_28240/m.40943 type:complete len:83 (-) Transcript_28240:622-870(-)
MSSTTKETKQSKSTCANDDDYEDDGDKYDDYDDYALQGGKGKGAVSSSNKEKCNKNSGGGSIYSSKHTRIRASRPRTTSPKR